MFILSDVSDRSDGEGIAGGFPCRDLVKERISSDSINELKQDNNTDNSPEANDNITAEVLEDNKEVEPITSQRPISSIPAELTTITQERDSKDTSTTPQIVDSPVNIPVFEIVDSFDEAMSKTKSTPKRDNDPLICRSNRKVGPPKFYGKR